MTRYCAVNSLAGCFRNSPAVVETTLAGRFDAAYVPSAIVAGNNGTDFFDTYAFSATGVIYVRFDGYQGSGGNTGVGPALFNGTTGVFRIINVSGTTAQAQYWNGSTWVNTGATFIVSDAVVNVWTIRLDLIAGSFDLWLNAAPTTNGAGWTGFGTTITHFRGQCFRGTAMHFSQIMIADYDLRDAKLMASTLNGNSAANTAGTGVYTDINEIVLDESTAVILPSAGKKGQTHAAITVPVGYVVGALVLNARGRASGGTVTDGKLGVRLGGTNYSSPGRGYTPGYEPRGYIWNADPSTSGAWSQTSFNNAEIYEEAA